MRHAPLAFLALALVAGSARADYAAGGNGRSLMHDGELRTYNVFAPAGYAGGSHIVPLVVDLHGAGSDASQQKLVSGWDQLAQSEGFLVAYPNGLFNTWNAGDFCCGQAQSMGIDDVGFLRALVAEVVLEGRVDPRRVYVTGLSNGGAMTQRLACEAADVFAAAAPAAFPIPFDMFDVECNPGRPIALLHFMGLTDTVVPYGGSGSLPSAMESFEAWRLKNGCGLGGVEETEVIGGSTCETDTSCSGDARVGLCSVVGSTFDPPLDVFDGHILYVNDDGIDLPARMWSFMRVYTLPSTQVPALPASLLVALGAALGTAGGLALRRR